MRAARPCCSNHCKQSSSSSRNLAARPCFQAFSSSRQRHAVNATADPQSQAAVPDEVEPAFDEDEQDGPVEYSPEEGEMLPGQTFSAKAFQEIVNAPEFPEDPPNHKSGFVAIIGMPNAGKSTILNSLVGQKLAIVSPKAQSTRRRVLGILSGPEHQMVLVDTPGVIADQRNPLEGRMMSYVKGSMREADAVVAIVDASRPDKQEEVLAMVQPPPPPADKPPMLVVLNKIDRMQEEEVEKWEAWWREKCNCERVMSTSALEEWGVDEVKRWMLAQLPPGPTLYPKEQVSEHPERFFVSEIVRERVFELYDQEIPYSIQVNVLEFKERKRGKDYILCELVVEKKSQKGIVVGAGGSAIKALATAARADIEAFLERPVYLEMQVNVDRDWRRNQSKLRSFGY